MKKSRSRGVTPGLWEATIRSPAAAGRKPPNPALASLLHCQEEGRPWPLAPGAAGGVSGRAEEERPRARLCESERTPPRGE